MRIISGLARGKRLASIAGQDIRPTPDKVRGAIFSILYSLVGSLEGKQVLDLFAGSGAMALEALSRGAERAILVDKGAEASRVIPANLAACGFAQRAQLLRCDAFACIPKVATEKPFDLIFLDPPYGKGLVERMLGLISAEGLLARDGIICAETAKNEPIPTTVDTLARTDRRDYGGTTVHFFQIQ
ncbi:methyltransferase [Desulfuromonas versatilis]|uniref:Methyltransferase n=1 Tax=Desulfuromonas versatilis TaxID=2802975 RepID=A0ABN6DXW5_9BACT|nr:methyltransferase [Desulfuromonas versatilis]